MYSRFLPPDFDPTRRIVLLAGKGDYPKFLWKRFVTNALDARVIFLETDADWSEVIPDEQKCSLSIGQIGKLLKTLEAWNAGYVIAAGQVTPGKLFGGLKLDLKAITLLAMLKEKNASTIFGALVREFEKAGLTVLDARSFLDDFMIPKGEWTNSKVKIPEEDLQLGIRTAQTIASLDIGQGLVVSKGTIVAVEAFEGTDAMLERAGTLCKQTMGFIKLAKKMQDFRFDVPIFGLQTLQKMKQSGILWAALESDKVLCLNAPQTHQEAENLGIKIVGF